MSPEKEETKEVYKRLGGTEILEGDQSLSNKNKGSPNQQQPSKKKKKKFMKQVVSPGNSFPTKIKKNLQACGEKNFQHHHRDI